MQKYQLSAGDKHCKICSREKEKAVLDYRNGMPQWLVCRKHHCHRDTLRRWNNHYDGTLDSLKNKSSRPLHSPKGHKPREIRAIKRVIKEHPECLQEMWEILRTEYAYKRSFGGFYRFIRKHQLISAETRKRYIPKPYDTPEMIGVKWQMDVKFVPYSCLPAPIRYNTTWFQYTMVDECSRETFKFAYREHSSWSTIDFVRRAIIFYGYIPTILQTDNGTEFTNPHSVECHKTHPLDWLCQKLGIEHKCIRPCTPRHNGKVERVHRNDQQLFYNHHAWKDCFTSFDNYQENLKQWTMRANRIPNQNLKMLTPNAKRQQCLEQLAREEKALHQIKNATREQAYTLPAWECIPKYLR